jgi:hypothetical protein
MENLHSCYNKVHLFNLQALLYSLKHKIPLVAYCEEQGLTLFEHPFVDLLHTVHNENKV